jgi:hypothetical protein
MFTMSVEERRDLGRDVGLEVQERSFLERELTGVFLLRKRMGFEFLQGHHPCHFRASG